METSTLLSSPAAKSYLTQYVSLVLIVLTFTIGSFVGKKVSKSHSPGPESAVLRQETPETVLPKAERLEEWLSSNYTLSDLFVDHAGTINDGPAQALAAVLTNHDLFAEIEIYLTTNPVDSLNAVASLYRYLEGQGVPGDAVRIFAVSNGALPASKPVQARVRWFTDEELLARERGDGRAI